MKNGEFIFLTSNPMVCDFEWLMKNDFYDMIQQFIKKVIKNVNISNKTDTERPEYDFRINDQVIGFSIF